VGHRLDSAANAKALDRVGEVITARLGSRRSMTLPISGNTSTSRGASTPRMMLPSALPPPVGARETQQRARAAWVQWHGPGAPDRAQILARARSLEPAPRARWLITGLALRADVDVCLPVYEPTHRTRLSLAYCGGYGSRALTVVAHGLASFIVDHPRHATRSGSPPKAAREPPAPAHSPG
jgi:hypothetical protein